MLYAGLDSMIFHSVASIIFPGLLIHELVGKTKSLLNRYKVKSKFSVKLPILVGVLAIPICIHPIDVTFHHFMEHYIRPIYPIRLDDKNDYF